MKEIIQKRNKKVQNNFTEKLKKQKDNRSKLTKIKNNEGLLVLVV